MQSTLSHDTSLAEPLRTHLSCEMEGETYVFPIDEFVEDELHLTNIDVLHELGRQGDELHQAALWVLGRQVGNVDLQLQPSSSQQAPIVARSQNNATSDLIWQAKYEKQREQLADTTSSNSAEAVPQRGQYTEEARQKRLEFVREKTGAALDQVGVSSLDATALRGNLESYVGSVEIPVGVAGPLWIQGEHARGVFYAPIATTEGALVASVSRGARALTESGAVKTAVFAQRMIRVPVFAFANMDAAQLFTAWLSDHVDVIKSKVKAYTNHGELKELYTRILGRTVHTYFVYETGDASGQNMVTTCTWNTCLWILERLQVFKHLQVENFIIEGVLSGDKRPAYQSFINGRGLSAQAEAFLPADVLSRYLKVTPQQLFAGYQRFVEGTVHLGMVGLNVNIANLLAAMFAATGQDIACVNECAVAHLHMELTDDGLYTYLKLPNLALGTVGGGTGLPQQRECLEMLGCVGSGKVRKLAEIITAFCLALDLSTLAAVVGGQFAVAHERLGRNRPVQFLSPEDMHTDFFTEVVSQTLNDHALKVTQAVPVTHVEMGSSIITELSKQGDDKLIGHFPYRMQFESPEKGSHQREVMVKSKPTDGEVIQMVNNLAILGHAELAAEFKRCGGKIDWLGCHVRELEVYRQQDKRFRRYVPEIYGIYQNDEREIYLLVMERLCQMELMDSADDVSGWTHDHIIAALDGIADIHSIWLGREDELSQQPWLPYPPTTERMQAASPFWDLLAVQAHEEFPEWFEASDLAMFRRILADMPNWWQALDNMPKTLIHNDFNPRNLAFRQTPEGRQLCVYDWELATLHVPQHDVAELILFVLDEHATFGDIQRYVEHHRQALEQASGQRLDPDLWWGGFCGAAKDLLINRVAMYTMAHAAKHYEFMERVYRTLRRVLQLIEA